MIRLLASLFFAVSPAAVNRSPEAELLARAISGEVLAQEGVGSIGAGATQATSAGPLANLALPLKTRQPLLLTLDLTLTL